MVAASPAYAEFEIQESTIDPGETQLQYRGAWHRGLPKGEETEDVDLSLDPGDAALKQSQDFELQYSPTSFWLVALTHVFDEPADNHFRLNSIEFESQFELVTREGDGLGLAIQGGTEQPVFDAREEADPEVTIGPIVELSKSNYTLVMNPLFFREIGDKNDQEGVGFEYGWQGRKELFGERLWLAVEMFGEIEDLSNAGPFDLQQHSIGPAFYYTFGKEDDFDDELDGLDRKSKELTVSVGAQFGLTRATSDVALKIFIGYDFD
ncbi:MAG: hypothetical protein QNJ62_08495 [Methyloceanibacter sp.]|nr:hypothetical protein [Methyloceanibacter sp.]